MHAIVRNALPDRASFRSLRLETPKSPAGGKPVPPRLAASVPAKVRGRLPIFVSPKSHAPSSLRQNGICNAARTRRGVGLPSPGLGAFRSQIDCGIPGRPPDRLVRRPSFLGQAAQRKPSTTDLISPRCHCTRAPHSAARCGCSFPSCPPVRLRPSGPLKEAKSVAPGNEIPEQSQVDLGCPDGKSKTFCFSEQSIQSITRLSPRLQEGR
jgi:hypothetical protein